MFPTATGAECQACGKCQACGWSACPAVTGRVTNCGELVCETCACPDDCEDES